MAEPALKIEARELAFVRRFEIADLSKHGPWLLKRFQAIFPDMSESAIAGYLRGILYSNEHLFLYQDNAVALAQLVYTAGIKPTKVVQERFVWVADRNDKDQVESAADFYLHFQMWGRRQGSDRMFVLENSDVPKALVEVHLGRLFDVKISHARI
jgi:hypothetical protein